MVTLVASEMIRELARRAAEPKPQAQTAARFLVNRDDRLWAVRNSLLNNYFGQDDDPPGYLESEEGRGDLDDHVSRRLDWFRVSYVPWLNSLMPLDGARVLEIGCGTGSSTVALAEQGAHVTGVDIDESSLAVARERSRVYEVESTYVNANATEIAQRVDGESVDILVFFASLEHMTHQERVTAMSETWEMLRPGALWCVFETPNRLAAVDRHTSHLPFFHWLPDDLALAYSRLSPRHPFNVRYRLPSDAEAELRFLREGRGLSYHEFELAMGSVADLHVVGNLGSYLARRNPVRAAMRVALPKARWSRAVARRGPDIHPAFYESQLDLIIRKTPVE